MNERKYNNQTLTDYLLDSLPEAEAEHFDELSFTDEEFADALMSAENDLVDSYVHGELSGATLEKFNSHYLASPLRREKMKFAKALQVFTANKVAETTEDSVAKKTKTGGLFTGFFSALNIFAVPNPLLQWGFAAVSLAFIVLGGLWIFNSSSGQPENQKAKLDSSINREQELPKQIEERHSDNANAEREVAQANVENNSSQQKPETEKTNKKSVTEPSQTPKQKETTIAQKTIVASFVLTPSLRGNQITNLSIPKETTDVNMNLELEADDYSAYRIALTDESGGVKLWRSGKLKPTGKGENKRLSVRFPAKLLKSQIYSLIVSGINAGGEAEIISNYSFRSVIK